jgi:starch synthase
MVRVLIVASEAVPFAKSGGLGEVAGSLPRALAQAGAEVRVVLPKYGDIPEVFKREMVHLGSVTVPLSWRRQYCGVSRLEHKGTTFYFLDNEYYFKRSGYYGYYDEAERFAFFCRGVLQSLGIMDFRPDILHCHDWQAALVPVFLQAFCQDVPGYQEMKTVLTIHNLKFQGVFPHGILSDLLDLSERYFSPDKLEFYGSVNYLKGGIVFSDRITTVSPGYAEEIKYPFFGEYLDGLIRQHEYKLSGILNGLDYEEYDPAGDPALYENYGAGVKGKKANKVRLQQDLGLPVGEDLLLLAMVSRLTGQKGLDLLLHIFDELLGENLQLVILGAGEERYERSLADLASRYPQKFRLCLEFNETLARRIYGAADLFLMPSLFEPCGLGQMIALRYGSVPVVRETGGLRDTVFAYNEQTGEGNGFSFSNDNAHDFLYTVRRALSFYAKPKIWARIVRNAQNSDCSWDKSAREYLGLFEKLKAGGS